MRLNRTNVFLCANVSAFLALSAFMAMVIYGQPSSKELEYQRLENEARQRSDRAIEDGQRRIYDKEFVTTKASEATTANHEAETYAELQESRSMERLGTQRIVFSFTVIFAVAAVIGWLSLYLTKSARQVAVD
jgi:hypothetical protein